MTQDTPSIDPRPTQQPVDPDVLKALGDLPEEFQGFPRLFQDEIRPALLTREAERQDAVAKARQARYVGIALAVIGGLAGAFLVRHPIAAIIAVVIGIGYLYWGGPPAVRDTNKDRTYSEGCHGFGPESIPNTSPGNADAWKLQEIVVRPRWD